MDKIQCMKILLGEYLNKHNLTTRQAAIMTGVSKTTIQQIASNQRYPRMDTLEQIARGLKVPFDSLYESDC